MWMSIDRNSSVVLVQLTHTIVRIVWNSHVNSLYMTDVNRLNSRIHPCLNHSLQVNASDIDEPKQVNPSNVQSIVQWSNDLFRIMKITLIHRACRISCLFLIDMIRWILKKRLIFHSNIKLFLNIRFVHRILQSQFFVMYRLVHWNS